MTCADVEARLTAYLDGELDATASSALRGHLRGCAACNGLADDHSRIAGALAALHDQPIDPPPALWDGVLARLGEAEEADARRPGWSLTVRTLWLRFRPHLLPATAIAAAAVVALVWFARRPDGAPVAARQTEAIAPPVARSPGAIGPEIAPPVKAPRVDVEAALAAEARRIDQLYAETVEELLADATEERAAWPAPRQRAFDGQLARLRAAVTATPLVTAPLDPDGDTGAAEVRERAWQRLVAFLQRAALGELVAEAKR